jgi:signal peptidase I
MKKTPDIKNIKWLGGSGLISALLVVMALWTGCIACWVAFGIFLCSVFFLKNSTQKALNFMERKWWIKWPVYFVAVFLLAIFCRVFLFEVYNIPSGSMRNTLLPGDKIIVNKLVYGPELPVSLHEVPWLNVLASGKNDYKQAKSKRLQGLDSIRRNDVVVFDHPKQNNVYIKRCVGLPGEQIQVQKDKLIINGVRKANPGNVLHEYRIYINQPGKLNEFKAEKNVRILQIADSIMYANISAVQKNEMIKHSFVDSLRLMTDRLKSKCYSSMYDSKNTIFNKTAYSQFLSSDSLKKKQWTEFNFGPLYIPEKGGTIQVNKHNIRIYKDVIEKHEGHTVNIKGEKIYIDQEQRNNYKFKQNYYFMMGDNRCNSIDSRAWGFVPKDYIIGKATNVLFSNANGKLQWERVMKKIN